jgi:uncharacterized protein (TIGR03435 family)
MLQKQHFALIALTSLYASQSPDSLSYIASIKLNNAVDARTISEYSPGGRLSATAVTVSNLLRLAYRIQPYQLVGAPSWISTKRYDISAKAENTPAPSQQTLLRALLKDRFKLAIREETREMPVFALVVARSDGKLGPQLTKSDFDCAAYMAGAHPPPQPGRTPNCATAIGMGTLAGKAIPMTQLASSLAPFLSRFTIDETGLTGSYDVLLTWSADPTPDATAPSIVTALQEQLGLKIVSEKAPVKALVIDHIEEPTAN